MKIVFFCVGILLSSLTAVGAAIAACDTAGCSDEKVKVLYPNTSGRVYVEMTGDKSLLDCSLVSSRFMTFEMSDIGAEAVYSMLLDAHTNDTPIDYVRILNGSSNCSIRYVRSGD